MKLRIKQMIWNIRKKKTSNKYSKKKKEYKKIDDDSVSILWDNFKCTNSWIIGVQEGDEEEEIENLFEKIMKENFPNLVKEIDIQVQEAQRIPNKLDQRDDSKTHHNLVTQDEW